MSQKLDLTTIGTQLCSIAQAVLEPLLPDVMEPTDTDLQSVTWKNVTVACIHILGGWNGTLSTEIETDLLKIIAQKMLLLEEVSAEDMDSVSRELTNIIAGNLKALLSPEKCIISIPRGEVAFGFNFAIPEDKVLICLPFKCDDHLFVIKLHQGQDVEA